MKSKSGLKEIQETDRNAILEMQINGILQGVQDGDLSVQDVLQLTNISESQLDG